MKTALVASIEIIRVTGEETGEDTFTDSQSRKNTKIKAVIDNRTSNAKQRMFSGEQAKNQKA